MNVISKQRRIVDYRNLTPALIEALEQRYNGEYESSMIRFRNAQGDLISAVPIETEDTIYLVKMSVQLRQKLEELAAQESDDDSSDDDEDSEDNLKWDGDSFDQADDDQD
ncbi:MAG: hypothetical protein ACFCUI_13845 [Bernardetiaceae bacterium]